MRHPLPLSEPELMIVLAIVRLGAEAYGVPLARELRVMRGRPVAVGSVYAALERLERKGLVVSALGEATPERGGRAKRFFRVTDEGLRAAHATRDLLSRLWTALPPVAGETA